MYKMNFILEGYLNLSHLISILIQHTLDVNYLSINHFISNMILDLFEQLIIIT